LSKGTRPDGPDHKTPVKIRIDGIGKTYRQPKGAGFSVLENISLDVEQGDFVMILGESGCGKSTLLNILAGLVRPSAGSVWINGDKLVGPYPSVFTHFQQPSLLPWLTVKDNIAFGCRIRGELEDLDYRVNEFIEMMGLSGFEKSYPAELSVGMACRVALARGLVGRPDVLLMDEPFASLDTFTTSRLQEELINIWLSERFTAVFVTHDVSEAILMGNKIVLLGGLPCRVMDVIQIDLDYPRRITDESFFHRKRMVLEKFKKAFAADKDR
jgi:ABC-type nitrate/sulfonate/bicarbonate transport system ATPase subunit